MQVPVRALSDRTQLYGKSGQCRRRVDNSSLVVLHTSNSWMLHGLAVDLQVCSLLMFPNR
jgi:hypothetical protein